MGKFKGSGNFKRTHKNITPSGEYINAEGEGERLLNLRSIVLNRLRYGPLTTLEGVEEFGITCLSARISELRKMGVLIETKRVKKQTRFGRDACIAQYILMNDKEET